METKKPDVLMVLPVTDARLCSSEDLKGVLYSTRFLTSTDFLEKELFCEAYDETIHALFYDKKHGFHRHHVHAQTYHQANLFVVGLNEMGDPVGFALIIALGEKWLVEYVMTHPDWRGRSIATRMMQRILREATESRVRWIILNCSPKASKPEDPPGLELMYAEFGFNTVA